MEARNSLVHGDIHQLTIKSSKYYAAYQGMKAVESHVSLPCNARPRCPQVAQNQAATAEGL